MTTPHYIALGDSMSIDIYPCLDLLGRGRIAVGDAPGLGAASLFHRNLADFYPDFDGRDLESREEYRRQIVIFQQLDRAPPDSCKILITLRDLPQVFMRPAIHNNVIEIAQKYSEVVIVEITTSPTVRTPQVSSQKFPLYYLTLALNSC